MAEKRKEESAPAELAIRRSSHFRAAPVDHAIVHPHSDGQSTAIVVNLVRRHLDWDKMRRQEEPSVSGQITFNLHATEEMVREFEAVVAPHQAVQIAQDLLRCVESLPPQERQRYGIGAPSPTKGLSPPNPESNADD